MSLAISLFVLRNHDDSRIAIELLKADLPDAEVSVEYMPNFEPFGIPPLYKMPFIRVEDGPFFGLRSIRAFVKDARAEALA